MTDEAASGKEANRAAAQRIAANIRAEVARQYRSHAWLAEALRVHRNTVGRRLSGKTPWRIHDVLTVARALGVDPAQLLDISDSGSAGAAGTTPKPLTDPV